MDLHHLGWHRITHLAPDLSQLTIKSQDEALRTHCITIYLPPDYPAAKPVITHVDLPSTRSSSSAAACAFTFSWSSEGDNISTLPDIISQYESSLHNYQTLWDVLDDIDKNCWVIEPSLGHNNNNSSSSSIPRSCCYRRLALLEKESTVVTLTVTLNPLDPTAFPLDYKFLGSEAIVAPLRKKLIDGYNSWRNDVFLRQNLEDILGVQLPQPRCYNQMDGMEGEKRGGEMHDADGMNCAICYSYRLLGENGEGDGQEDGERGVAPEDYCDNPSCGKPFHKLCLAEWLKSDTSTKQAFDKLYGACPYCGAPVSVDVTMHM
jgi:E3 ubiquitin-protein ligase FANCL